MNTKISQATIDLIANVTRSLISSGAIHPTEQAAVVCILKAHTAAANNATSEPSDSRQLLTPAQAARLCSVSKRTILRMIEAGELEAVYLRAGSPKTLRIKLTSLDAAMTGREVTQ